MICMCSPVPTLNIGTWDGLILLKERRNYGKADKLGDSFNGPGERSKLGPGTVV